MKVRFWQWLQVGAAVGASIERNTADDNRITFEEGMTIVAAVCANLGVEFDSKGSNLIKELVTQIIDISADGKITVNELIKLGQAICDGLGVSLDTTGFSVKAG